jgi:hypothetical protein
MSAMSTLASSGSLKRFLPLDSGEVELITIPLVIYLESIPDKYWLSIRVFMLGLSIGCELTFSGRRSSRAQEILK